MKSELADVYTPGYDPDNASWNWFRVSVRRAACDVPPAIFDRLRAGVLEGRLCREYGTKDEALADLKQAWEATP